MRASQGSGCPDRGLLAEQGPLARPGTPEGTDTSPGPARNAPTQPPSAAKGADSGERKARTTLPRGTLLGCPGPPAPAALSRGRFPWSPASRTDSLSLTSLGFASPPARRRQRRAAQTEPPRPAGPGEARGGAGSAPPLRWPRPRPAHAPLQHWAGRSAGPGGAREGTGDSPDRAREGTGDSPGWIEPVRAPGTARTQPGPGGACEGTGDSPAVRAPGTARTEPVKGSGTARAGPVRGYGTARAGQGP